MKKVCKKVARNWAGNYARRGAVNWIGGKQKSFKGLVKQLGKISSTNYARICTRIPKKVEKN